MNPTRPTESDVARFWTKVDRREPGECWPISGHAQRSGHVGFWLHTRMVPAHRVAWMIANEDAIPDGLVVRHDCDNPPCCNPTHLRLGTVGDNNRDRHDRGRTVLPRPEQIQRPGPGPISHGTLTAYVKRKCRCDQCRQAMALYRARVVECDECGREVSFSNLARHRRLAHGESA